MAEKRLWGVGVLAGFIPVICCLGPIVAVVLGVGSASVLFGLQQYSLIFVGLGLLLLTGVSVYAVYKHRQCCTVRNHMKEVRQVSLIFSVGILTFAVLQFGIVPAVSQVVGQTIGADNQQQMKPPNLADVKRISLRVEGMTCAGCALAVQQSLLETPGVVASDVNWKTGNAKIQYNVDKINSETIKSINLPSPYKIHEIEKLE